MNGANKIFLFAGLVVGVGYGLLRGMKPSPIPAAPPKIQRSPSLYTPPVQETGGMVKKWKEWEKKPQGLEIQRTGKKWTRGGSDEPQAKRDDTGKDRGAVASPSRATGQGALVKGEGSEGRAGDVSIGRQPTKLDVKLSKLPEPLAKGGKAVTVEKRKFSTEEIDSKLQKIQQGKTGRQVAQKPLEEQVKQIENRREQLKIGMQNATKDGDLTRAEALRLKRSALNKWKKDLEAEDRVGGGTIGVAPTVTQAAGTGIKPGGAKQIIDVKQGVKVVSGEGAGGKVLTGETKKLTRSQSVLDLPIVERPELKKTKSESDLGKLKTEKFEKKKLEQVEAEEAFELTSGKIKKTPTVVTTTVTPVALSPSKTSGKQTAVTITPQKPGRTSTSSDVSTAFGGNIGVAGKTAAVVPVTVTQGTTSGKPSTTQKPKFFDLKKPLTDEQKKKAGMGAVAAAGLAGIAGLAVLAVGSDGAPAAVVGTAPGEVVPEKDAADIGRVDVESNEGFD